MSAWRDMTDPFPTVADKLRENLATANAEIGRLKAIVDQVDDVLVVNWVPAKDGDYRQALADLVTTNIAEHDDPLISPTARDRQEHITALRTALRETREALEEAQFAEWVDSDHGNQVFCPLCRMGPAEGGHTPECRIRAVLARHAHLVDVEPGKEVPDA